MKRFWVTFLVLFLVSLLVIPVLLIGLMMFFFIFGGIFNYLFQAVYYLVVGWAYDLPRLLLWLARKPLMLGIGLAALVILPMALHFPVARVFLKKGKTWQFRQTVAVAGILCCFTVTSFAMFATTQEFYTIANPAENLTEAWNMGKRIDLETGQPLENQGEQ